MEVSGIVNDWAFVRTGSTKILFPRVSVARVLVGMIIGVVTASSIGLLAEMIMGMGSNFGAATWIITGPETTFGGAISGEKILPLQVILLVPAILLMS